MRDHLATLLDDFRRHDREIAVVRYQGNRRRVTTYGEIARLAGRFAALLAQRGIGPGDRVLIWAENSAEWIAAFYGCMLRGVLAVPLDAMGTADFAARVAADVSPKLAVGDAVLLSQLGSRSPTLPAKNRGKDGAPEQWGNLRAPRSQNRDLGHPTSGANGVAAPAAPENPQSDFLRLTFEEWPAALPGEEASPVEGLSNETPLQILFTSGTTGDPKGIVLTHGNVLASIGPIETASQPYMRYERLIHPLRILHTLPLSHVFGQTMGLWVPPIYTAELHFESRLVAPRIVDTIRRERISVLAAVPRVLALLKTHLESTIPGLAERVIDSKGVAKGMHIPVRWWRFRKVHRAFGLKFWAIISGGGALQGALEQFWNAIGLVMVQGYGMTETTAIITLNHPFHVAEGTIGKPLAGREVKLGPDGEVMVRGASISGATWSGGALHRRENEWLSTGDLAQAEPSGELRFLGRKSEVIVTASGVNLYPEDLEAAIDQEPGVTACAVVPWQAADGPEPYAVLAFRGTGEQAAAAVEHANSRLAEFQRLRRWILWPEPDLPRTSTGKVRRKTVAEWLARVQTTANPAHTRAAAHNGTGAFGASSDWLLALIAQISGEAPQGVGDELRLTEDLHLDSLGRVQLEAAIEERLGIGTEGLLDQVQTLGELRHSLQPDPEEAPGSGIGRTAGGATPPATEATAETAAEAVPESAGNTAPESSAAVPQTALAPPAPVQHLYPHWPWLPPFRWLRSFFVEAVMRPLIWLLANPRVVVAAPDGLTAEEPMLIVANHVTAFDGALLEYALPGPIRRRMAIAMSGEMLEDYRHFRNPEPLHPTGRFFLPGPLFYVLVTAVFNVFPLPRQRDFQRSFAHAGDALDHGFNVMVFPEGARTGEVNLMRFRPGIGLLVKQSGTAVLPMAMRGLADMKMHRKRWFRSGKLEIRVGRPIRFSPAETEAAITARLHDEVQKLLEDTERVSESAGQQASESACQRVSESAGQQVGKSANE